MIKKIEIRNLNFSKRKQNILKNINLDLSSGLIYGLIGENGAGKSTLMKTITHLIYNYKGSISYLNENNQKLKSYYAKLFMSSIIEQPEFYTYLSGIQNIKQFLNLYNQNNSRDKEKMTFFLKLFEMDKYKHKKVKNYSLGMKQKLGLIQALIIKPKVLVLDEPFNGLDPTSILTLKNYIFNLKNEGCIVLISSHLLSELEGLCDNIIFLKKGSVLFNDKINNIEISQTYSLEVDKLFVASKYLLNQGYNVKKTQELLTIECPKSEISSVVKNLCISGYQVFSVIPKNENIESIFLKYNDTEVLK